MVEVEFVKRTCVNGWWLLPGSRAEFATAGQAGFLTVPGNAKLIKKPRAGHAKGKKPNAAKAGGTDAKAGDTGTSEGEPAAVVDQ